MSDYNSSLPVRTENSGDVVARIGDGTTPSQQLAVDTSGRIIVKLDDGNGNLVTSQVNGAQQALDVGINVAGVQIDPRQIRALTATDVVSVVQSTSPWVTKDQSDGPVTPGTVASFSSLIGGQYNSALPTLTTGQQAAIQVDSSGRLLVSTTTNDDHNYGTVGATTLRTAAQIGNATGAADFNAGATGAQTLRVVANQGAPNTAANGWFTKVTDGTNTASVSASGHLAVNISDATGSAFSATNPLPVTIDTISGTKVDDYKDASAIAVAASDNHDYTVTAAKTLYLTQIIASASGKAKMLVSVETGVASGTFTTKYVQFNSTANTNMDITLADAITVAAGVRVRVTMTNRDLLAQDLYSTICGHEI